MKTSTKATLTALVFSASAFAAGAQDAGWPPNGDGQNGPGPRGHRPPPPAIINAIDVNRDHVIDAQEIANASAQLAALDKNGDGVLTPDEFAGRPPRLPDGPEQGRPTNATFDRPSQEPGGGNGPSNDRFPPGPPPGGI